MPHFVHRRNGFSEWMSCTCVFVDVSLNWWIYFPSPDSVCDMNKVNWVSPLPLPEPRELLTFSFVSTFPTLSLIIIIHITHFYFITSCRTTRYQSGEGKKEPEDSDVYIRPREKREGAGWVMRCPLTKCFLSVTESRWFANTPPLHPPSLSLSSSSSSRRSSPYFLHFFTLVIPFFPWIVSRIPLTWRTPGSPLL